MALSKTRVRVVGAKFKVTVQSTPAATKIAYTKTAAEMQEVIRESIDDPYPPASAEGTPPHRRSGYLHDETTVRAEGTTIKVRVPQYGIWQESGTSRMRARPFIRPAIHARRAYWAKRLNMHARAALKRTAKLKRKSATGKRRR